MLSAIKAICLDDPARETCGVVIQNKSDGTVCVVPVPNTKRDEPNAAVEFEMDPQVWLAIQKSLRKGRSDDYELVYRFHSHPNGIAWPSSLDIAAATYPQRELIYSVRYNNFFCYAPMSYASTISDERYQHALAKNAEDHVVVCPITEYTLELPPDYETNGSYEDFAHWRRRHR